MSILIIVEHNNNKVNSNIFNLITCAKKLNYDLAEINFFIAGFNISNDILSQIKTGNIYIADNENYKNFLAEEIDDLIVNFIKSKNFTHVLLPASTFGKNLAPRLAAKLDVNQLSDVTEIISNDTFVRPIYAGNAFATCIIKDSVKLLTIRSTAFDHYQYDTKAISTSSQIIKLDAIKSKNISKFIKEDTSKTDRPDLSQAKIVVSGGRGLQSKENFKLIEQLAETLGAAVGATRAAVDAGYVSNDYQVGQTGKIVAPDLYIAIGISGAMQHLAGIKDSKIIVAINTDPEAPIMQIADYALEGDLFNVIPELCVEIEKLKN
tara:strand:+ start:13849 stop:14811 length:963 start_codon:yes stop_codon:yes gene_type:complete